ESIVGESVSTDRGPRGAEVTKRQSAGPPTSVGGDRFPPLAPPLGPDENPELRVPAIGDVVVGIEVVEAVAALLFSQRMPFEHRSLGEVLQLEPVLLVDFLGF